MNIEDNIQPCAIESVPKKLNWVIAEVESQSGHSYEDTPKQKVKFQVIDDNGFLINHFRISFLSDKTLRENRSMVDNWQKRVYTSSEIKFLEDYV